MATVALPLLADAAIGTIGLELTALGTGVLAGVGSYIDNAVLLPALFPPEDIADKSLDSIQIGGGEQGSPQWFVTGRYSRVPGTYIWMGKLIKDTATQDLGGGKGGGGGGSATTFDYFVHCAVAFCRGPIAYYRRVYADGKLVYKHPNDGPVSVTSSKISIVVKGDPSSQTERYFIQSEPDGPNLILSFYWGLNVTSSGFTTSGNNGTFHVEAAYAESDGTSVLEINREEAVAAGMAAEAIGASVTLDQAANGWLPFVADEKTFHLGSSSQSPDSFLEGKFGVGKTPGFINTAWIMFQRLHLERHGNRAPLFEAVVARSDTAKVSDVIDDIMTWGGVEPSDYDVTALTSIDAVGYKFPGLASPAAMLAPILLAYDLAVREEDGKLVFYERENAETYTLTTDQYPCSVGGQEPQHSPFRVIPQDRSALPQKVIVRCSLENKNSQSGVQSARRLGSSGGDIANVDLSNLSLTKDMARGIAERILRNSWANSFAAEGLFLPPDLFHLQEGDVLIVPEDPVGEQRRILIRVMDQSPDGLIEVKGVYEERQMFGIALAGDEDDEAPDTKPAVVPSVHSVMFLSRPLSNDHVSHSEYMGVYHTVGAKGSNNEDGPQYMGGSVWVKSPSGSSYQYQGGAYAEAPVGFATTALGGVGAEYECWDYENTVDVFLESGTLSTSTREAVAAMQANVFVLGRGSEFEVFGAVNCTLIDTNTYRLSTLRRGLRGSEDYLAGHVSGEDFAQVIGSTGLQFFAPSWVQLSDSYWKTVGIGQELTDVPEQAFDSENGFGKGLLFPGNLCPMKPWGVRSYRDASDNVTVSWERRTRSLHAMFMEPAPPETNPTPSLNGDVPYKLWVVYLINTALGTGLAGVVNQKLVFDEQSVTWTATELASSIAGYTTGDAVTMLIAQKPNEFLPSGSYDAKKTNFLTVTVN